MSDFVQRSIDRGFLGAFPDVFNDSLKDSWFPKGVDGHYHSGSCKCLAIMAEASFDRSINVISLLGNAAPCLYGSSQEISGVKIHDLVKVLSELDDSLGLVERKLLGLSPGSFGECIEALRMLDLFRIKLGGLPYKGMSWPLLTELSESVFSFLKPSFEPFFEAFRSQYWEDVNDFFFQKCKEFTFGHGVLESYVEGYESAMGPSRIKIVDDDKGTWRSLDSVPSERFLIVDFAFDSPFSTDLWWVLIPFKVGNFTGSMPFAMAVYNCMMGNGSGGFKVDADVPRDVIEIFEVLADDADFMHLKSAFDNALLV